MNAEQRTELETLVRHMEKTATMIQMASKAVQLQVKELAEHPTDVEDEHLRDRVQRTMSMAFMLGLVAESDGDAALVVGPLLAIGVQEGHVHVEVTDEDPSENPLLGFDAVAAAEQFLTEDEEPENGAEG